MSFLLSRQILKRGALFCALTLSTYANTLPQIATPEAPAQSASAQKAAGLFKRALHRRRAAKAAAQPKTLAQITKDIDLVADTLSEDDIQKFLRKAGLINQKMLNMPKCIMVQKASGGGSFTENLFYIFYYPDCDPRNGKKLLFVVKELKQKSAEQELYNLYQLQNSPELRALGGVKNPNYPQIVFSEDFYRFHTRQGETKYILLIHGARGQSLNDIYQNKTTYDPVQAFRTFGNVLGHFSAAFLRGQNCLLKGGKRIRSCVTINHGDLHPKNVFFDGTYIYFIDTETLARSLRQRTPLGLDLIYFYNMPIYFWTRKLTPEGFHERLKKFGGLFRHAKHAYVRVLTNKASEQKKLRQFIHHYTRNRKAGEQFIKVAHAFIRERGEFDSLTKTP